MQVNNHVRKCRLTNLDCATITALHQIADVLWLNASSNE